MIFDKAFTTNQTVALIYFFLSIARRTGNDANLRSEAVEAMNVLIKNSAKDVLEVVRSTLQVVLSQLEQSFSAQILTPDDRDRVQGLQSLLCGNLQVQREMYIYTGMEYRALNILRDLRNIYSPSFAETCRYIDK